MNGCATIGLHDVLIGSIALCRLKCHFPDRQVQGIQITLPKGIEEEDLYLQAVATQDQ